MGEPTDEEIIAAGVKAVVTAKALARHWEGEVCPICKSSLRPTDPNAIGWRSPSVALRQMYSNLEQITGHCGECMLSPAEVQQNDIKDWVWVRLPSELSVMAGGQSTIRAKGLTVHELMDYIEQQHPNFKTALLQAIAAPNATVDLSINWVPVRGLQGLETSVKGGDYVKFLDQKEQPLSISAA